ncbi:MFS transporter [Mycolicibacterium moriokaense]|nr:MFS transporter [Mycolicibacterium moriokaense]
MKARSSAAHRCSIVLPHARDMPSQRRNLRLFLGSQAASQSGTWLQFVALAWLAAELTGSGVALGWITVATFGPLLVLGPLTGAVADRMDKHRLLIGTQALVVGQAVALGAVILTGAPSMALVYGLATAFGLLHAVENPVRRALLAEVVDANAIPRAVSFNGSITAAGRIVGPVAAGALIASAGIGWCFIAVAVSYVVALSALLLIQRNALHMTVAVREPGAVRAGLRYAWSVPDLRVALMLTAVVATFGFNHQVLIPLLAEHTFGGGVGAYTLLYVAIGVGSVFGALTVARCDKIDVRFLAGAVVAFAVANGLIALAPNLTVAVIACAATGAAGSLLITAAIALLQQRCAPAMRCRVMALSAMVIVGGLPIGGPIVGVVADVAGPRAGVAVGSVAAVAAAALVARHLPQRGTGTGRVEESSLTYAS